MSLSNASRDLSLIWMINLMACKRNYIKGSIVKYNISEVRMIVLCHHIVNFLTLLPEMYSNPIENSLVRSGTSLFTFAITRRTGTWSKLCHSTAIIMGTINGCTTTS